MTWCVYAIALPVHGALSAAGIAGERVTAVRAGRLTALVGGVRRIPRPTEDNLRRYDRVLRALLRRVPALLPARFGTHVRDLAELEAIVTSRERSLRRQLALVRHRVQMTVRIVDDSDGRVRAKRAEPKTGAEYLRSRARDAAAARAVPRFDPLRAAVRRWVRAERVERHGPVATVYHLVPRGSAEAYQRTLTRVAAAAGARVVVSGPWPPYAFADPLS